MGVTAGESAVPLRESRERGPGMLEEGGSGLMV